MKAISFFCKHLGICLFISVFGLTTAQAEWHAGYAEEYFGAETTEKSACRAAESKAVSNTVQRVIGESISTTQLQVCHESLRARRDVRDLRERLDLREIGDTRVGLRSLMSGYGVTTAAVLTAFNPGSVMCSDEANFSAQAELVKWLDEHGYVMFDARGEDSAGVWPSEASVLVLGIPQHVAEQLADRFGQNAFLWVGTPDSFVSLKLRKGLLNPSQDEIMQWIESLPMIQRGAVSCLKPIDLAWLMSVNEKELMHWLYPQQWDLNEPWPLAKPDGSAMDVGTELDRMFRIVAAGQVAMI